MRTLRKMFPVLGVFVVLALLWPTLCMSSEFGDTSCQSAVGLHLPWGESADGWGMVVAALLALAAYLGLRRLNDFLDRRSAPDGEDQP